MKLLIPFLLAATAFGGDPGGRLFVRMSRGFEVFIDGVSAGVTSTEEGGKLVKDVAPGPHRVVVRSPDGREGSFDVTIVEGQTRDVSLSALGLRKKLPSGDEDMGSLRIACLPDDCTVKFRDAVKEKRGADELAIDAIPPGRYPLTASRGSTTLRMDIDVVKGTIVTVEANFTSGTIRVTGLRRRSRRLNVTEARDALTLLAVPPHWKTAIRGALPAGIYISRAVEVVGNGVKVSLRVPSDDVGVSMIRSVSRSTLFTNVVAPGPPRRDQSAWVVDLIFYFP